MNKKADGAGRRKRLPCRVSLEELGRWNGAAEREGKGLSRWVREALDVAAGRPGGKEGKVAPEPARLRQEVTGEKIQLSAYH